MDNKDIRAVWILVGLIIIGVIYMLVNLGDSIWTPQIDKELLTQNEVEPTPTREPDGVSVSYSRPIDWVIPTVSPTPTLTPTLEPTPTLTLTPTFVPTATPIPTKTPTPKPTKKPTPKPTPRPTPSPKPSQTGFPREMAVPRGGHDWKPWARHTAVNLKSSPQYKMQKNYAKTDSNGLRYCIDPYGEKRYCVALNEYWCGGDSKDIGRCFDVVMANGSIIKCCLGDTKKTENSQNKQGKFGSRGELLEFQAEASKLNKKVNGDVSKLGGAFEGEAVKIIAYDYFIEGFGK